MDETQLLKWLGGGTLNVTSGVIFAEAGATPIQFIGGTLSAGAQALRVSAGAPSPGSSTGRPG